jgi:hypothetical protein
MLAAVASKMRNPRRPSMVSKAKSLMFEDVLPAVSMASSCRWLRPSVGDSLETRGRRTYSAGDCCRRPSMTQVR